MEFAAWQPPYYTPSENPFMRSVFEHDSFLCRRKIIALVGKILVTDESGGVVAFSRQKAFKLREEIRVFSDESEATLLLMIKARNIIDFGATYDVTSHYRAAGVFEFFQEQELNAERLHEINRRQVQLLKIEFERLDGPPSVAHVEPMSDERRGGFLAIRTTAAVGVAHQLRKRGVHCDARGDVLRLGPAPYLRDDQLSDAIRLLAEVLGFRRLNP